MERAKRRRHGLPNYRLVRYADDWCLVIKGTKDDAEALRADIAGVLSTMGLRLSQEKTLITHIDDGLDFLGWRIQRHRKRGTSRSYVYTYPAKKSLRAVMAKVKTLCRQSEVNQPLDDLLRRLNPAVARLVRLLPARVVVGDLLLLEPLHVANGLALDTPKTPPVDLEGTAPPLLRRRLVASQRGPGIVRPGKGRHHPLPLPRFGHPLALAGHR